MIEDNQIVEKIKVIAHQFLPDAQVLLFGSRARNDARTDSDYDILLIINETLLPKDKIQIISKIRKALVQLEIPIDVLIQSRSEIEKKKNLPGHIVRRIIKEAIIL